MTVSVQLNLRLKVLRSDDDLPAVLSRLEAFLPAMKEANEALARKASAEGTESVDIAAVEEVSSGSEAGSEDSDDEDSQLQDGEDEPSPPRKPYIRMVCSHDHASDPSNLKVSYFTESWIGSL